MPKRQRSWLDEVRGSPEFLNFCIVVGVLYLISIFIDTILLVLTILLTVVLVLTFAWFYRRL